MTGPVPVHLICGFLGSGKTTLLRRILAEQPPEERLVVLVNEFGDLGIDGQLLEGFDSEVLELTSGCICCTLRGDFVTSLSRALQTFTPDRVLIEATGLAETGELAQAVAHVAEREDVRLASVSTVVDAEIFSHREMMGPLYFNQIKDAQLLLLNKTDLIAPEEVAPLSEALSEINPRARIMPVVHCAVDRQTILAPLGEGLSPEVLPDLTAVPGHEEEEHEHEFESARDFIAFSFQESARLDPDCFRRFLEELPWEIMRLKGFVRFPQGTSLLNYTYRRPDLTPVEDEGLTRLAFVGWRVDPEEFLSRLRACLLSEE